VHAGLGKKGEMGVRTQASIRHQHISCLQAGMHRSHQGQVMGEEGRDHQLQEESGTRVEQAQQPYHGKATPWPLHRRLAERLLQGRSVRHGAARAIDQTGAVAMPAPFL
jgi:hypothetical protein